MDDATVTIEIHQLASGKGQAIAPRILHGPADRCACLCLAALHLHRFLPMFFPSRHFRFLFMPMAEAVLFAMIGLLCPVAHACTHHGELFAGVTWRRAGLNVARTHDMAMVIIPRIYSFSFSTALEGRLMLVGADGRWARELPDVSGRSPAT